ncbi:MULTISPECIES: hypothetical protein [Eisenbergiella]|uniref:Uncharacterized protein n=1 Tax=Eisenbergiella porci TaxID=2652274 RepID=A0A6N7WP87_9FIRM|nr:MULTISPECIES: hypothetical protein [Eisenbergiella]MDY2654148.1 hypothetical protein [Eisenbergiella porci]MSS91258.1 hypothetical protein [Eisenbergiella porci]
MQAVPQPAGFLRTVSIGGWGSTVSITVGNKYYKTIKWKTRDYIHILNMRLYDNSGNLLIDENLFYNFSAGGGAVNNESGTVNMTQYENYNVDYMVFTATGDNNNGKGYLTISAD